MMSKGISKGFFILILFIVTAAFLDVLGPYYSSVLWAVILAVIFHPVKKKLKQYVGERNGVVSLLTVALICLIVFTPLAIIASSLAM
ncbi:TPA: AI-2E family transporter, partial [Serratia marcescens]